MSSLDNVTRILFVTGLPRSGTTLIESFLRAHDGVILPLASGNEYARLTQSPAHAYTYTHTS